ncbi:uncharacterized protein LOC126682069 [Mercurialis annua]|uniref:uncharacterized protein LOC126682069 n=1 Tax=Mercurialis annua TaxID=3986 RepID=UPI00215F35EC|nr:uncharacterized protein LOC126682069 [Mercurialis annua]
MKPLGLINAPVACKVSYFIDAPSATWDRDKLAASFSSQEVSDILKIPLSRRLPPDKVFWYPNKNGFYTVKSGYYKACAIINRESASSSSSAITSNEIWKRIWNCSIQPKIKHFLWRICHGALPCTDNLVKRSVPVLNCCPRCGVSPENDLHALKNCDEVRGIWLLSPLSLRSDSFQASSMVERMNHMFTSLKGEDIQTFLTCLWVIWNDHNNIVFNNKRVPLPLLFRCVSEFSSINSGSRGRHRTTPENVSWKAPPANAFKVNSDAAVALHRNMSVAATVCRDATGKVLKCGVKILHGIVDVELAEAQGIMLGLQMAITIPGLKMVVESDALNVIHRLQHPSLFLDNIQLVIEDCLDLVKDADVVFQHVRRNDNTVAHTLAKWGVFFDSDKLFDGEISFPVNELIILTS